MMMPAPSPSEASHTAGGERRIASRNATLVRDGRLGGQEAAGEEPEPEGAGEPFSLATN